MFKARYNCFLLGLICIGFLASLWIGWERNQVEENAKQVEIALELHDLEDLAYQDGKDLDQLLIRFRDAGMTSLVVEEASLERLIRRGWASLHRGGDLFADEKAGLLNDPEWQKAIQIGEIKPEWFYLAVPDPTLAEEIEKNISYKLGQDRVQRLSIGGKSVVGIYYWAPEKVMEFSVGLLQEDLRRAERAGVLLVARPSNGIDPTELYVEYLIRKLEAHPNLSAIIPAGVEMIGYRNDQSMDDQAGMFTFGKWMKENQVRLGMVERADQLQFIDQEGLMPLASSMDFDIVRTYTIYKEELKKLSLPVAIDRWPLAVKERNIKLNLIRKFEKLQGANTLTETHELYIRSVAEKIQKEGYTLGRANIMAPYHASTGLLVLVMSSIVAAGVFLLSQLYPFNGKAQLFLWVAGSLVLAFPLFFIDSILIRQIGALAAACLFPAIALSVVMDIWESRLKTPSFSLKRVIPKAVGLLFFAGLISFVGASQMAAMLSDIRFFAEMALFRGVKLTFVLPIFLAILLYLARFSITGGQDRNLFEECKRVLKTPASIQFLLIGMIALIAIYILLGRSGHTAGFEVPGWEIKIRSFLEKVFFTRPRSKELFIGHPALVLATYFWLIRSPRWLHFGATIAGSIGIASMVETFAHVRSPLFLSYVRGFDGIWAGALLGVIGILIFHVLYLCWKRWEESHG